MARRGPGTGVVTSSLQVRGSRRAVMIVDDHPITGAGIAAQLRQQGFDVAAVVTAVEMLDATGDMVVRDLRLPGALRPGRRCLPGSTRLPGAGYLRRGPAGGDHGCGRGRCPRVRI